jgi:threonine dehydrogenase-like Zn-dependent dehydrogenase
MESARVSDSRVDDFANGDVVGTVFGHKTGHTADPFNDLLTKLPPELDPILGIYIGQMGPIAANGILHADVELLGPNVVNLGDGIHGRPALVIGAGIVGMLTALFAQAAGASEVVIADPSPFRRLRAECLGITAMTEDQAWAYAKAARTVYGSARSSTTTALTYAAPRSTASLAGSASNGTAAASPTRR